MKICSIHQRAKVERRRKDGRIRFVCLGCDAERLKRHRKTAGRATVDPMQKRAWKIVENAVAAGTLVPKACERCPRKETHAHHDDYSKPLEVRWLCPQHHKDRHRELRCEAA